MRRRSLVEELLHEAFRVTASSLSSARGLSRDAQQEADSLLDYLYDTKDMELRKSVAFTLKMMSDAGEKALSILRSKGANHVNENALLDSLLLKYYHKFAAINSASDFFPITVYVAATSSPKDEIGLLVHADGKLEMFEGNDEADDATYQMVNKLLGVSKKITVWGSHGENTVQRIIQTKTLPAGLYVSTSKNHAAGFWGPDRVLFSGVVDAADLRQEDAYAFKTIGPTSIDKVRAF